MKAVAYLRVSTEAQADEGYGLDAQRAAIKAWARAGRHRVVAWLADEGVSGSNGVESREALPEALAQIEDAKAGALVVARLDRLARNLTVQEGILARVWSMDASIHAADLGEIARDDPDDPMRTALRQMVGVFAQLERGMIAARLRAGRRQKAAQGGYAYGAPPFGWRADDGELVPIDAEQSTIARIKELRTEGASLRAIAATLEAEGRPTRRGGHWQPTVLAKILAA